MTPSTWRRSPPVSPAWPAVRDATSTPAPSARPSWRWRARSCSSVRPAPARAWPCWPSPTATSGSSPTRWRCSSNAWARVCPLRCGRLPRPAMSGEYPVAPGDQRWLDDEAGPVVRPYTVTGGRSQPRTGDLDLLTYVEALYAPEADLIHLQPEHRAILSMTATGVSVAEIAARVDLPLGVVRVLI